MQNITLDSAFGDHSDESMKQIQENREYEGDTDYVQYNLPPLIRTERMFSSAQKEIPPEKERAFTIANKAREAMNLNNNEDAIKMAFHSLTLDPLCIDGWLVLCKILFQMCDGDTVICNFREILYFSRFLFKKEFELNNGRFYSIPYTRPYIRILSEIGSAASISDRLDLAIFTYEEILRLNHKDNTGSRNLLLAYYLKIIGRIKRFPSTRPIRTVEQAEQLMYGQIDSENIFEENNLTVRWAKLCFAYLRDKNWKEIAKEEYEKNELIFKVVLNDIQISEIPPSDPNHPEYFILGNKNDDVRQKGQFIKDAMKDWPDFMIDLCKYIKNDVSSQFRNEVMSNAPNPENMKTKQHKEKVSSIGQHFLEQARSLLSNRQFEQAIEVLSVSKRGFFEACNPSLRWYLHAPFAIASNRATAAAQTSKWDLVRFDTRFTLVMKPDHERSYLRLPEIGEAFKAKQLIDDFTKIAERVKSHDVKDIDEWKDLAKKVIGLTSIAALSFAAEGILTENIKEELIKVGINDCYCSVNVGTEYSLLPWLSEADLEPNIEEI